MLSTPPLYLQVVPDFLCFTARRKVKAMQPVPIYTPAGWLNSHPLHLQLVPDFLCFLLAPAWDLLLLVRSVATFRSFQFPLSLRSDWSADDRTALHLILCITSLHLYIITALHLHHIIVGQLPIWLKNSTDSSLRRIKRILNRNPSRKLPQIRPSDTVAAHLMVIHRLSNGWRHQRTRGSQSGSNAQDPSSDSLFCEIRWRGNYSWEQDGNALLAAAAGCKDGWVKCFWWSHLNIITHDLNSFIFVNSGILAFI